MSGGSNDGVVNLTKIMSPLTLFFLGLSVACIFALLYDIRDRIEKAATTKSIDDTADDWTEWALGIMTEQKQLAILVRRLLGMHNILELRQNADRQRIQALESNIATFKRSIAAEADHVASLRSMQGIIWEEWRLQYAQMRREIAVIEERLKDISIHG